MRENPTAPIQLPQRPKPSCLNEFCRLGCICASLTRTARVSHCGRFACMFGCSCLKQKMVLLKNLENSDSSPSTLHGGIKKKKRKRKRRMKMAYGRFFYLKNVFSFPPDCQKGFKVFSSFCWMFSPEGFGERLPACRTSPESVEERRGRRGFRARLRPQHVDVALQGFSSRKDSSSQTCRKNRASRPTFKNFSFKCSQVRRRYRSSCARIRVYNRKVRAVTPEPSPTDVGPAFLYKLEPLLKVL